MPGKLKIGDIFSRLTVETEPYKVGSHYYVGVVCACGKKKPKVPESDLRRGHTKSCGCLHAGRPEGRPTTHGKSLSPIYGVWLNMKKRCTNVTGPQYTDYGGRGIIVCDKWQTFEGFYEDMGDPPFEKASLDRVDNNGNYCPENVRWSTRSEQNNNRRNSVRYEFRGQQLSAAEVANLVGMNVHTLQTRIYKYGMTVEQAATLPVMTRKESSGLRGSSAFSKLGGRQDGNLLYLKTSKAVSVGGSND